MLLQILRFQCAKCVRLKCAVVLRKLKRECSTRARPLGFLRRNVFSKSHARLTAAGVSRVFPAGKLAFLYIIYAIMNTATNGFPLEDAPAAPFLPTAGAPRSSASRMIADALRAAIVEGTLAPGAPLRQDAIARHFSVSAIPVREALRQLESEGWAKVEVHKGATVAPLSANEAREIYEIRSALESLALGLAIPRHTAASLREVTRLCKAAEREPDPSLYVARNEAFHMSLYAPAGRPQLCEMIANLHRRGERYLRLKFGFPEYKGESDHEHVELLDAVQRRDVAAAQSLVAAHLIGTGELIYRFLTDRAKTEETAHKRKPRAKRARVSTSPSVSTPADEPATRTQPSDRDDG
jgi:DNA-binding GntR family transcriptional regulator